MNLMDIILAVLMSGGSGGGSVTVDTALSPTSTNPVQNKVIYADLAYAADIVDGKQDKEIIETVTGSTPSITPEGNTTYKCGEVSSLTISNPPATGKYRIVFTSGSTPTAAIIPPSPAMRWQTDDNEPPQGFPAANTRYEISVEDTYVVLGEWPVPGVSA